MSIRDENNNQDILVTEEEYHNTMLVYYSQLLLRAAGRMGMTDDQADGVYEFLKPKLDSAIDFPEDAGITVNTMEQLLFKKSELAESLRNDLLNDLKKAVKDAVEVVEQEDVLRAFADGLDQLEPEPLEENPRITDVQYKELAYETIRNYLEVAGGKAGYAPERTNQVYEYLIGKMNDLLNRENSAFPKKNSDRAVFNDINPESFQMQRYILLLNEYAERERAENGENAPEELNMLADILEKTNVNIPDTVRYPDNQIAPAQYFLSEFYRYAGEQLRQFAEKEGMDPEQIGTLVNDIAGTVDDSLTTPDFANMTNAQIREIMHGESVESKELRSMLMETLRLRFDTLAEMENAGEEERTINRLLNENLPVLSGLADPEMMSQLFIAICAIAVERENKGRLEGDDLEAAKEYAAVYVEEFRNVPAEQRIPLERVQEMLQGDSEEAVQYRDQVIYTLKKHVEKRVRENAEEPGLKGVDRVLGGYITGIERNEDWNKPADPETVRKMTYGFYEREIRKAAEAAHIREEDIETLAAFPEGRMDALFANTGGAYTMGEVNQVIFGTSQADAEARNVLLDQLRQFIDQQRFSENPPAEIALFDRIPAFRNEERYRQEQEAKRAAEAARRAQQQRDLMGAFYDVPSDVPNIADFGIGNAEQLPSMQADELFMQAFRKEREKKNMTVEHPAYHSQTVLYAVYKNAADSLMNERAPLTRASADHLIHLLRQAAEQFEINERTSVPEKRDPSGALFAKMKEVMFRDREILEQINRNILAGNDNSTTMQQQIMNAKLQLLNALPQDHPTKDALIEKVTSGQRVFNDTQIPALLQEKQDHLAGRYEKQEDLIWKRMNTIAAALDRTGRDKFARYTAFSNLQQEVYNFVQDRPLTHTDFITGLTTISQMAARVEGNGPLQQNIVNALVQATNAGINHLNGLTAQMRNVMDNNTMQSFLTDRKFPDHTEHFTLLTVRMALANREAQLREPVFSPYAFAEYHILHELLSAGKNTEIERLSYQELEARAKEFAHSDAMQFMSKALPDGALSPEEMDKCYKASIRFCEEIKEAEKLPIEVLEEFADAKGNLHPSGVASFDQSAMEARKDILDMKIEEKKELRADHMKRVFAQSNTGEVDTAYHRAKKDYLRDRQPDGVRSPFSISRSAVQMLGICKLLKDGHSIKETMIPGRLADEKAAAGRYSLECMELKNRGVTENVVQNGETVQRAVATTDNKEIADTLFAGMKIMRERLNVLQRAFDFTKDGFVETPEGMEALFIGKTIFEISQEYTKGHPNRELINHMTALAAQEPGFGGNGDRLLAQMIVNGERTEHLLVWREKAYSLLEKSSEQNITRDELIEAITGKLVSQTMISNTLQHGFKSPDTEKPFDELAFAMKQLDSANRLKGDPAMKKLAEDIMSSPEDLALLSPYIVDGSIRNLFKEQPVKPGQRDVLRFTPPTIEKCRTWAKERKLDAYRQSVTGLSALRSRESSLSSTYAAPYLKDSVHAMEKMMEKYVPSETVLTGVHRNEIRTLMTTILKGSYMAKCAEGRVDRNTAEQQFGQLLGTVSMDASLAFSGKSALESFVTMDGPEKLLRAAQNELQPQVHREAVQQMNRVA